VSTAIVLGVVWAAFLVLTYLLARWIEDVPTARQVIREAEELCKREAPPWT
jgi:hypothetical protein